MPKLIIEHAPDIRAMVREHCEHEERGNLMPRVIITHAPDIPFALAARHVDTVMQQGRISTSRGIPMYAFVTVFVDNIEVLARDRRSEDAADSFLVRRVPPVLQ